MASYQDRMRKIQGLLRKAESTDNEHEAEAFMAKAHAIMAEMAVDEAMVRANMTEEQRASMKRPIKVDFEYSASDSNARGKLDLLWSIAQTNRVQMVNLAFRRGEAKRRGMSTNVASQWASFVGYEEDIERVKMLYASLLIQAQRFGLQDFRTKADFGVKKSRFLTSYMLGFSSTIKDRLRDLNAEQFKGTTSALIVRTDAEVNEAFDGFFPNRRQSRSRNVTASGAYWAGVSGGQRADIGRTAVGGSRRQLGSGK